MESGYRWQRARIVKGIGKPGLLGRELWIRIGSRDDREVIDQETLERRRASCLITNMTFNGYAHPMTVDADRVEMLCRPNGSGRSLDFAEDVDMVRYEDWLKG